MSDSSSHQRIVFGILAAAALGALFTYIYKTHRPRSLIEQSKTKKKVAFQTTSTSASSGKQEEDMDEDLVKAQELKEKGNQAFKVGKFDDAIQFYTEGLKLAKSEQHVLYSNRSAAFAAKNDYSKALEDAQKCIEVNPSWSKGYFRVGKALLGIFEFDKAFSNFLKGLQLDPKSEELKKLIEQTRGELGPGELDTRLIVDNNMIKLYFKTTMEDICKNKLNADFEKIREIAKEAVKSQTASALLEHPYIKPLYEKDAKSTLRVLIQTLIEEEKGGEEALLYAENAYNLDSNDAQSLQSLASAKLRIPPKRNTPLGAELIEPLELIRKALEVDPQDPTIAHTFASIILRYTSLVQPQQSPYQPPPPQPVPIDIKSVLKHLRVALANPSANALLIADSGIRLWFRLFEDPEIGKMLMEEEQQSMQNGVSPTEAYVNGLKKGAFNKLCLEPFFMEALSKIVFNNPALERVLTPFRTAMASVEDDDEFFDVVSELLYAMALQCYRNNYAWNVTPEDSAFLKNHRSAALSILKESSVEDLSKHLLSNPKLARHLSVVALYEPLIRIDTDVESKLYDAISKIDLAKLHPWLSAVFKKTLLDPHNEDVIAQNIQSLTLTPIPNNTVVEFLNNHIGTFWDSAGMAAGRMIKITVAKELEWVFPHYKPIGFDAQKKTRVLIAGCSSGVEVMQANAIYDNVELVGIDNSTTNIAYAIRQNEELGVKAKFFLADLPQLERTHFNNELFDMLVVHGALNHFSDPMEPWKKLANLLRPGGIMRVSVFSKGFLELVSKCRKFFADKFSPPIFETPSLSSRFGKNANSGTSLPRVLRNATEAEIRKARTLLLEATEPQQQQQQLPIEEEVLESLLMTPSFYSLNEFADLLFHPQILAFSFTTIGSCLDRLGLKLIGFEFPGIMQESILRYRVEYPDDPHFTNVENLEKFEEKYPDVFKNFAQSIIFACEKPVSK